MKITDSKVITVGDEVIFAYKSKPSHIIWCPKCNKEVEILHYIFDDNDNIHYHCSDCETEIEWKEQE